MSNRSAVKRAATKTPEAPPVNGTSEHQSLSKYIQARFDECSRSQKDVAQYIVDHLDEAAFQTAEELARRANTSSSTVVRFSQALGFEGFPELQAAAREEYRRVNAKASKESGAGPSTRTSSRRRSPPTTSTSRTPRARSRAARSRR
jgi:DNA-binding MurR/RpiR family transcriptional regulator